MNPTGGNTTGLSPDAFQTAIDAVAWERYDRESQPFVLSVRDARFFRQAQFDGIAHIWDEASNVGNFRETGEQEEIVSNDVRIGNTKTKRSIKYFKQIPISDEAFRTDKVELRAQIGQQVGDRARATQDLEGILNSYGDAFAGSVNTTGDGQALASNSHTTLTGVTVDNLETAALSPDALWTCIQSLAGQRAQDGELGGQVFSGIVVPFNLLKTAKEILDSTLVPQSGENQENVYDTIYGNVALKAAVQLTSTYNSATNAATSYHLVSDNHQMTRRTLYGLSTDLVEPKYSGNDTWVLKAKFHEATYPATWTGYVGSNGSA